MAVAIDIPAHDARNARRGRIPRDARAPLRGEGVTQRERDTDLSFDEPHEIGAPISIHVDHGPWNTRTERRPSGGGVEAVTQRTVRQPSFTAAGLDRVVPSVAIDVRELHLPPGDPRPEETAIVEPVPEGEPCAQAAARRDDNVFAELLETVKVASLGQICDALFEVGGRYRRAM